jgi:peptidoglycan hydrolase-like protein with peptidoglycan-binding domain
VARWGLVILPLAGFAALVVVALTSSSPSEITERSRVAAKPVTYVVGPRVLQSDLVLRGSKHFRDRADVLAPPTAEGNRPVLTSLDVAVDATVRPCGLLGSVADRPIIALPGAIQPYRDLRPGDIGTDVSQLQTALAACGHPSDDPPGVFGSSTAQAVLDTYGSIGCTPLTTQGTLGQLLAKRVELDRAESNAESLLRATTGDTAAAKSALDAARAATTEFSRIEGVVVPARELAVVGALPGRVVSIDAALGQSLTDGQTILTIESGPEVVRADITQSQKALLTAGLDAVTDGQPPIPLKVTRIVSTEATALPEGTAPSTLNVELEPLAPDTLDIDGSEVTLRVALVPPRSADLVVPSSAIVEDEQSDSARVLVLDGKRQRRVAVSVGETVDGWVEIIDTGKLRRGDKVVLGSRGTR